MILSSSRNAQLSFTFTNYHLDQFTTVQIIYHCHNACLFSFSFNVRFEFGAAIFIAWGGSFLDVLGGAMLAASCTRSKQVSKYPKSNCARTASSSSNKEYVWATLRHFYSSNWETKPFTIMSRNKKGNQLSKSSNKKIGNIFASSLGVFEMEDWRNLVPVKILTACFDSSVFQSSEQLGCFLCVKEEEMSWMVDHKCWRFPSVH